MYLDIQAVVGAELGKNLPMQEAFAFEVAPGKTSHPPIGFIFSVLGYAPLLSLEG